ncbi:MAG: DUF4347 domain-containing protein, partial [Merismopedia sp. SIO2A8]|nr:DUF4347 domain-containing protein [Merismopedia sp. SIO2A8]
DANVTEYHEFINVIQPTIAAYILPKTVDGIGYITRTLEHYPSRGEAIAHIHIIAHGFPGGLYLGNTELSLTTIAQYGHELREWFSDFRQQQAIYPSTSLSHPYTLPIPQLLLYGCCVAAGDAGAEFLEKLYHHTGAALHASTQPMGNAAMQGTGTFDTRVGLAKEQASLPAELVTAYSTTLERARA